MVAQKAHYIIFHPDSARDRAVVKAKSLVQGTLVNNWKGKVHVDKINVGNEDPFVFADPWLYSYCHASQLRRNKRPDSFIQNGSKLIFVSGQEAEYDILAIDTVFVVSDGFKWGQNPLQLPNKYSKHYLNKNSTLWSRHLYSPFGDALRGLKPSHTSVSHTFESKQWKPGEEEYSFLPLDSNHNKFSIPTRNLSPEIGKKIKKRVKGKYPVLLDENEICSIMNEINSNVHTKVLKNIRLHVINKASIGVYCSPKQSKLHSITFPNG